MTENITEKEELEKELLVLQVLMSELRPLDQQMRVRVMRWLIDFYRLA